MASLKKPKKPKLLKYPKKPGAKATSAMMQNWLKRISEIDRANASKTADYNKAVRAVETEKKDRQRLRAKISGIGSTSSARAITRRPARKKAATKKKAAKRRPVAKKKAAKRRR